MRAARPLAAWPTAGPGKSGLDQRNLFHAGRARAAAVVLQLLLSRCRFAVDRDLRPLVLVLLTSHEHAELRRGDSAMGLWFRGFVGFTTEKAQKADTADEHAAAATI